MCWYSGTKYTSIEKWLQKVTENISAEYILAHPMGEVQHVPITSIYPYERNPRRISAKAVDIVAGSIREFGWTQPIVVDGNGIIIIGHTRRQAAIKLGLDTVPVLIETRLTEDQTRALRILDNRSRDYSQWDYPVLMKELEGLDEFSGELDLADWSALITGFEEAQAEALLELDNETEQLITDNYTLVCTFDTKENADMAAPSILNLHGAVNVRYSGPK